MLAETTSIAGSSGCLYLVATPIGNLEDIGLRALGVLRSVSLIAAEDTRHSRRLLSAHGIQAELISYRQQNRKRSTARLLAHLKAGGDVALVSDAGTPGISDPGRELVARSVARGVRVVPIPGACAAIAALSASGLPTQRFVFLGFLPRKAGALRRAAEGLVDEPGSLVLYESPRRLGKTLAVLAEVLGPRTAVVARELTKVHETFDRGDLPKLAERYSQGTRGEVVLVVAGADGPPVRSLDALGPVVAALSRPDALSAGEIARLLAPLCGVDRREIYRLAVGHRPEERRDD